MGPSYDLGGGDASRPGRAGTPGMDGTGGGAGGRDSMGGGEGGRRGRGGGAGGREPDQEPGPWRRASSSRAEGRRAGVLSRQASTAPSRAPVSADRSGLPFRMRLITAGTESWPKGARPVAA